MKSDTATKQTIETNQLSLTLTEAGSTGTTDLGATSPNVIDQAKDGSEKEPMHEALDELMSVEIEELNPSLLGATDEREMSIQSCSKQCVAVSFQHNLLPGRLVSRDFKRSSFLISQETKIPLCTAAKLPSFT